MRTSSIAKLFVAGFFSFAAVGCAAQAEDADESQDGIVAPAPAPTEEQALEAFLADGAVRAQISGHRYEAPSAVVAGYDGIGRVNEFLVATHYDATPEGLMDATFSRTVAATVRYERGSGNPPTVRLVDVKAQGEARVSSVTPSATPEGAIEVFLADPVVLERIGDEVPTAPQAVLLSTGSSFGHRIHRYLVVSHITLGDEPAPAGLPTGGLVPVKIRVAAVVFFSPFGDPPSVSSTSFEFVVE